MMPERPNVLLIMSDEHRPDALGVSGHPLVETPTLDRLATEGTRFTNAYCSSPLCVPSRASFATGRYIHEIDYWDNATPYEGTPESWGHHFAERDVSVTTIGKLDFKPGVDDGFDDQRLASHRASPDVNGLYRNPPNQRENARDRILAAGPLEAGEQVRESDERRTQAAIDFIEERTDDGDDDPWVLSVNYDNPHFPLRVGREYYDRYPLDEVDLPYDYPAADDHPILEELRDHFDGRNIDEEILRRTRAAYYGLCTALDDYISRLLDTLTRTDLDEETLVIYTSNHGEPLGDHELWWKCCMYEQAVGVPLIMYGPDIETGAVIDRPISLLDLLPTMADAVNIDSDPDWRGKSLLPAATGQMELDPERVILSEYHAHGTSHGMFMLRQEQYKYIYYPHSPDQLFDLDADPRELNNLADDPEYEDVRSQLERELRRTVDPEAVDRRALDDQQTRTEQPVEEWW